MIELSLTPNLELNCYSWLCGHSTCYGSVKIGFIVPLYEGSLLSNPNCECYHIEYLYTWQSLMVKLVMHLIAVHLSKMHWSNWSEPPPMVTLGGMKNRCLAHSFSCSQSNGHLLLYLAFVVLGFVGLTSHRIGETQENFVCSHNLSPTFIITLIHRTFP